MQSGSPVEDAADGTVENGGTGGGNDFTAVNEKTQNVFIPCQSEMSPFAGYDLGACDIEGGIVVIGKKVPPASEDLDPCMAVGYHDLMTFAVFRFGKAGITA